MRSPFDDFEPAENSDFIAKELIVARLILLAVTIAGLAVIWLVQ